MDGYGEGGKRVAKKLERRNGGGHIRKSEQPKKSALDFAKRKKIYQGWRAKEKRVKVRLRAMKAS